MAMQPVFDAYQRQVQPVVVVVVDGLLPCCTKAVSHR